MDAADRGYAGAMTGSTPSGSVRDDGDDDPGEDAAVSATEAHRAALVATGAARDLEEARMFLAMLGLDDPRDHRPPA